MAVKSKMISKRILFFFSIFSISFGGFAQEEELTIFKKYQDTLAVLQKNLFRAKTDNDKYTINKKFLLTLERALRTEKSFSFPFDSLNQMARLTSPDKQLRIFNWNVPLEDGTHEYFGFLQRHNKKTGDYDLFSLRDKSEEIRNPDYYTSDHTKWFGMLYYKIIQKKVKKKTYYVLLGWDGNNKVSSKKIIDVLTFTSRDIPQFGDAIFQMGKKTVRRVIFEFSSETVMSVKYDDKKDMIIFNHMAPLNESLKGQYQFYGPDFSFDGLKFEKRKWTLVEDIDARNEKRRNDALYKDPKER